MTSRRIGPKGRALIKEFEGCHKLRPDGRFSAYPDPASGGDPWTIGWGSTGPDITPGTVWTQEQCDARFDVDVQKFAAKVSELIGDIPTTPGQFGALVSFAYNVGAGNLASSTLLRKHKAGNHMGAAAEFAKWNRAAGRVMAGLTRRRAAERVLYELPA